MLPPAGRGGECKRLCVPARHRLVEAVPKDVENGLSGGSDAAEKKVPGFRRRRGENEVRGIDPLRGAPDPDPDPQERRRPEFLLQRAQSVVPTRPAASLEPHLAGREVQIIVEDDQVVGGLRVVPVHRRHREAAPVHVRLRPGQKDDNAFRVADPALELPLPDEPYPQGARQ